ncbi:peptide chain release factor N(5)-glutamine methyltransferase [Nakamurella silvestris]|nr:peptide chain release factor N(5)-glutamine methyltransferase [Nakamurella silvestris]
MEPHAGESLADLLAGATEVLTAAGVADPAGDALALARFLITEPGPLPGTAPAGFVSEFAGLVERRRLRVPLARILGRQHFRGLDLRVDSGVFLSRKQAESIAGAVIEEVRRLAGPVPHPVVVDLCTGSGAVALAVATEVPDARVIAVDLSPQAVALARWNDRRLNTRLLLIEQADATSAATLTDRDGSIDVVVANPPYIPPDGVPREIEVADHDPAGALFGGGVDGLDTARGMVATAARLLRPGGLLILEHADVQAARVRRLIASVGAFTPAVTHADEAGAQRYAAARRVGPKRFAAASIPVTGPGVKDSSP